MNIPGWIDLQVNGFKGINFSSPYLKLNDIKYISSELYKYGVVGYCPTIISSSIEVYQRNLPIIARAIEFQDNARVLGIHLEGPFINPLDGPRGIHPKENIIPPSIEIFKKFYNWANGTIALITIAPEQPEALNLIEYISNNTKITVSMGHTLSNREIIKKAKGLGAKSATHVGNGISETINRHKNPIWTFLADDDLYGLFITDGFHIPDSFLRVALRAKNVSKFIVTSDLIHFAGMKPDNYELYGLPIKLELNGYLHIKNSTQLAGSTSTMMECINYLYNLGELSAKDIEKVGYYNPLKLINKEDYKKDFNSKKIRFKDGSFIL